MSPHPSDSPSDGGEEVQRELSEPHRDSGTPPEPTQPLAAELVDEPDGGASQAIGGEEEPITAKLADTIDESPVRVGSPFATDPFETQAQPIEQIYDVGPLRYTAMGAVAAAVVVLLFALVGVWWFPAGGAMIAALGCMLSIFGLYSNFRFTAAGLLTVHLALFVMSYGRSLG